MKYKNPYTASLIKLIFGLLISISGLVLLVYETNWRVLLAVVLYTWGNNISIYHDINKK